MREKLLGIFVFLLLSTAVQAQNENKTKFTRVNHITNQQNKKNYRTGPRVLRPAKNRRKIDIKQDSLKKIEDFMASFLYELTYMEQGYNENDILNKNSRGTPSVSTEDYLVTYRMLDGMAWTYFFAQTAKVPFDHNNARIAYAVPLLKHKKSVEEYEVILEKYSDVVDYGRVLAYDYQITIEGKEIDRTIYYVVSHVPRAHFLETTITYTTGKVVMELDIINLIYPKPSSYEVLMKELRMNDLQKKIAEVPESLTLRYETTSLNDGQEHDDDIIKILSSRGEEIINLAEGDVNLSSYDEDITIEAVSEGQISPCTLEFKENNEILSRVNLKKGDTIVLKKK